MSDERDVAERLRAAAAEHQEMIDWSLRELKAHGLASDTPTSRSVHAEVMTEAADAIDSLRAHLAQSRAEKERLREAEDGIGKWLSAALDDPDVCDAMKMDIRAWFDACATLANPDVVTGGE